MRNHEDIEATIEQWLAEQNRLARSLEESGSAIPMATLIGQFRRGKSTLLEALRPALPVMQWIEMPGLNALERSDEDDRAILDRLDETSVALYLFTTDPPLSDIDVGFLRELTARVPCVFLIQTQIDRFAEQDWRAAVAGHRGFVDRELPDLQAVPIYPVSARSGAGMEELIAALHQLDPVILQREALDLRRKRLRTRGVEILSRLGTEAARLEGVLEKLSQLQSDLTADDAAWRVFLSSALSSVPEYAHGEVLKAIRDIPPRELEARAALNAIFETLRHIRDELARGLADSFAQSHERVMRSLERDGLLPGELPPIPAAVSPDPAQGRIPVRVIERGQERAAYLALADRIAREFAPRLADALAERVDAYFVQMSAMLAGLQPAQEHALQLLQARRVIVQEGIAALAVPEPPGNEDHSYEPDQS